ncbi:MAG TPA: PRC-barrel domain-containing protein [Pseudolabrys sp.]|jgi:sporulation protein YlmC with PRC-barrel domain|nr:PRC-barrel domain-containing protein [Pseudolabrys sp.]
MMKQVTLGAAIGALMISGALAQSPNAPAGSTSSPPAATSISSSGKADLVTTQKPDQWLATKFKGTNVLGADDKKIGDVSDILFDKDGKIQAYVVSVGGFLGMGAKEVALAPASFTVVPGDNGGADQLKVSMTQDELKNAQSFARYEPPKATTTGSAPGGGGPGAMRPSGTSPTPR